MKRRNFLSSLAGGMLGAATPFGSMFRTASAQTFNGQTLIVVFQRGGCDGLNTVIPFGDAEYYSLRPTIGVPAPSPTDPTSALGLDSVLGLHPSLRPLHDLYNNGNLAVLPTVHYPDASRSHFTGQDWIERAAPRQDQVGDGWLNRHIVSSNAAAQLRAAGIGTSLPQSLKGSAVVSSFNRLTDFDLGLPPDEEALLLQSLQQVYDQSADPTRPYRQLVNDFGRVVFNDLSVVADLDPGNYTPTAGVQYPNSTFGTQMQQIAILIKAGIGLELATVGIGGWDTHSDQGDGDPNGRQARRHADFAQGIAALYADLETRMDDVIIMSMTEFGRTAAQNGSFGTDHGNAAAWFAAGNSINGGVYGDWPGLTEDVLYRGRYLAHTVDFRDVMGDILSAHLGSAALPMVLPGHTYSPLGMVG